MNGYDYNTVTPYKVLPHKRILYNPCHDYDHISRYKGLRQITHITENNDRFMTLEGPNAFTTNSDVNIYDVPTYMENRIDLIANQHLGAASYGWIISNFNDIEDNFTVIELAEEETIVAPDTVELLYPYPVLYLILVI